VAKSQPTHDLRGLLIPDVRLKGAAMTATSEAGARPHSVTRGRSTLLGLSTCGDVQTAETYRLATTRAGAVGPYGGAYRWRKSITEDYREWDPPTAFAAWEYVTRSTTAGAWRSFDACRLPNGRIIAVATKAANEVVAKVQTTAGAWTEVSIEDTGSSTCATIDVLPSGRVCVWYIRDVDGLGQYIQLRMAYSDDSGSTWTVGSAQALDTPADITASDVTRIRARYVDGSVVLFLHALDGSYDYLYQWASGDAGATFSDIVVYEHNDIGAFDVQVQAGSLVLATVERDTSLTTSKYVPYVRRMPSPFSAFTSVAKVLGQETTSATEWGDWSATHFDAAYLALLCDDDGAMYLYGTNYDSAGSRETVVRSSYDGGATWETPTAYTLWAGGDTSTYAIEHCAVPERGGRALLFHKMLANPGTGDPSMCVAYLGGSTTRALPWSLGAGSLMTGVMRWNVTYLPVDEPDDIGSTWTQSTTGWPSVTLTSDGLDISQAGGEQVYWNATPATSGNGYGILAQITVSDYNSGTGYLYLRISDGTNGYAVQVEWTSGSLTLKDVAAGTIIATASVTITGGFTVIIACQHPGATWTTNTGAVRSAYICHTAGGPKPDREWTTLGASAALTSAAYMTKAVQFGGQTGAASFTVGSLFYSDGSSVKDDTIATSGWPTRGRTFSGSASPGFVGSQGLRLWASGGPTYIGDTWTLTPAYDYPVTALDPWASPSPRRAWRSTDTTQQDIVLTTDAGYRTGDVLAVYLQGCNFATASLYADSSGTTKLADISTVISGGLKFTRTRDLIVPAGTGGSDVSRFFPRNILAGASWQYSVGGTVRKVRASEEGSWLSSAITGYKPVQLLLDDYAGGDSASGSAGILRSDRVLIVTDVTSSTDTLMLRISAQNTAEGYFTIGALTIGRFVAWEQQYSWGRSVDAAHGYEVSTATNGTRRALERSPGRTGAEIAWTDGVDASDAYRSGGLAPDYFTLGYTSAPPIGTRYAGLPGSLLSLIRDVGPSVPVVYIPALPQAGSAPTSSAPITITDAERLLYGRIMTETLRLDTVHGTEFGGVASGEVWRTGTVRIEEEL
jgi:hypothetical protein